MKEEVLLVDSLDGKVYQRLKTTGNYRIGTGSSMKFEGQTNNKVAKAKAKIYDKSNTIPVLLSLSL